MRPLVCNLPVNQTFQFLTETGGNVTAKAGPAMAGNGLIPNKIVFVDASNVSSTEDGSFYDPYNTFQDGIDRVVTEGWNSAIIMVAPGTYVGSFEVPASATALANLVISGWSNFTPTFLAPLDVPVIGGQLLIDQTNCLVQFCNLHMSAQVTTSTPSTDSLGVAFDHCVIDGTITAGAVTAQFTTCALSSQTIAGAVGLTVLIDGYTWGWAQRLGTNFLQAGDPTAYARVFYDAGHTTYAGAIAGNVAVGTTSVLTINGLSGVRPGDYAEIIYDAAPATDYIATVGNTGTDSVSVVLRNISRAGGVFNEAVHILIHHQDIAFRGAP